MWPKLLAVVILIIALVGLVLGLCHKSPSKKKCEKDEQSCTKDEEICSRINPDYEKDIVLSNYRCKIPTNDCVDMIWVDSRCKFLCLTLGYPEKCLKKITLEPLYTDSHPFDIKVCSGGSLRIFPGVDGAITLRYEKSSGEGWLPSHGNFHVTSPVGHAIRPRLNNAPVVQGFTENSVKLSPDGKYLMISTPYQDYLQGGIWIFHKNKKSGNFHEVDRLHAFGGTRTGGFANPSQLGLSSAISAHGKRVASGQPMNNFAYQPSGGVDVWCKTECNGKMNWLQEAFIQPSQQSSLVGENVTISADGKILAFDGFAGPAIAQNPVVWIYRFEEKKDTCKCHWVPVAQLSVFAPLSDLALSPDGTQLAATGLDNSVYVWTNLATNCAEDDDWTSTLQLINQLTPLSIAVSDSCCECDHKICDDQQGHYMVFTVMDFPTATALVHHYDSKTHAWTQVAQLTDTTNDIPGSVAINKCGNMVAIGFPTTTNNCGAVSLFTRTHGTFDQWQYTTSPTDAECLTCGVNGFGTSVSLTNHTLAVSNPNVANFRGGVCVFKEDCKTQAWSKTQLVSGNHTLAYDRIGHDLALSQNGNELIVSANQAASETHANRGAVYILHNTHDRLRKQWEYAQKALQPEEKMDGDSNGFGFSLDRSVNGKWLAIGAFQDAPAINYPTQNTKGTVFIYHREGMHEEFKMQTIITTPNANDAKSGASGFGASVRLSNDAKLLFVGAPLGESGNGAVYVYVRTDMTWTLAYTILPPGSLTAASHFGWWLEYSDQNKLLIVSARANNGQEGAVVVEQYSALDDTWHEIEVLIPPPAAIQSQLFGWQTSISTDGSTLLVGAPDALEGSEPNPMYPFGRAYWYQRNGSTYQLMQILSPPEPGYYNAGAAVMVSHDGSILSYSTPTEPFPGTAEGAVWQYRVTSHQTSVTLVSKLVSRAANSNLSVFTGPMRLAQANYGRVVAVGAELSSLTSGEVRIFE